VVHAVEHGLRHEGLQDLHDGTSPLEQAGRFLDGRTDLGVDSETAARVEQQADAMFCAGRLMLSRASGCAKACIIRAASATLRVIGPAARPM
jgi:hypothetical protein